MAPERLALRIAGMTNADAVRAVTDALEGIDGVVEVESVRRGAAVVWYDATRTDLDEIAAAIGDEGFDVVEEEG